MQQLNRAALGALPPASRPRVDPAGLRTRVVHFGIGAFHRAHQALYTENAVAHSGEPWGIAAVAPRSAATVDALRAQDCLYSVTERRDDERHPRVVGALTGAYALGRDGEAVDALLTDPEVTVVTLTIAEKGYRAAGPDTVVGRLAAGLATRMRSGAAPITVVSCDNMADNGAVLRTAVQDAVRAAGGRDVDQTLELLNRQVTFPATVVDRIVPATAPGDLTATATALGVHDALPVSGEPYRQWVLEDRFTAPRPAWELDGALLVPDVAPYPAHQTAAAQRLALGPRRPGIAAGRTTVADAMADGWGEPARQVPVRRGRAHAAGRRPGPRPGGTPTTWSPASATRPCTTCCGRSPRTPR
ncbi:mannitol dehydrogenase [Streptomyces purpurascens]